MASIMHTLLRDQALSRRTIDGDACANGSDASSAHCSGTGATASSRRNSTLHLELAGDDVRRRGESPEAARRAARLQAGGVAQAMDALRDQRGLPWLDDLGRDVRHAVRTLRRSPAFTAVALLTLALGIGANTAIFSIVNGVILRPLGYPEPEQLMYLTTQFPALGFTQFWVSPPEYLEFREINRSFSAVGAYTTGEVNLTAGDRPLRVRSASVDEHLLTALGVHAGAGTPLRQRRNRRQWPAARARAAPAAAAAHRDSLARVVADRLWRPADRGTDGGGQRPAPRSHWHHAARRRRHGQPHRDLAAARAESRPIVRIAAATSSI